jgi:Malectin domain
MMNRLVLVIGVLAVFASLVIAADPATAPTTAPSDGAFRMKAGSNESFTDSHGRVWQAQKGFADGDDVERDADLKIEKTDMPALYRTEHYDMSSWSTDLPNGAYTVNLYFCETYEGIGAPGDRVFSVKIGDKQLKDFDIYKEAGGACKPITKTFDDVQVSDGKLKIEFVPNAQSPCINGIEIIPKK